MLSAHGKITVGRKDGATGLYKHCGMTGRAIRTMTAIVAVFEMGVVGMMAGNESSHASLIPLAARWRFALDGDGKGIEEKWTQTNLN